MGYYPTESMDVVWETRANGWRRISTARKDVVTDLPEQYRHLPLTALPDTSAGKTVKEWCLRWGVFPRSGLPTNGLDLPDFRGKGLFLHGPPGTGKTTMACIAAQHISDLGWSTKFVRAQDYYSLSRMVMDQKDEEERDRLQSALDCYEAGWKGWRLLVLDDLGYEYRTSSGWSENLVINLIRSRYSDAVPTIITSNIDPASAKFSKRYGEALADYIREACWLVKVAGESRRG
jgi:hypothetical protein